MPEKDAPHNLIEETVSTGGVPSLPGHAGYAAEVAQVPELISQVAADATQEYVAAGVAVASGGFIDSYAAYARALPAFIDPVSRDFGADIYERMATDYQLAGDTNDYKLAVLANGVRLEPAIPEGKEGHSTAQRYADFCQTALDEMETALEPLLEDMLNAFYLGNKVAEIVLRREGARLMLDRIKPKPREALAFVVDNRANHIGFVGAIAGHGSYVVRNQYITDPNAVPNYLPKSKFATMTFRPINADPRGTSAYRPCYGPWWEKQQTIGELLKFIAQFAGAAIVATLGQGSQNDVTVPGPDGKPVRMNPAQELLKALQAYRNGGIVVAPFGTTIENMVSDGAGIPFFTEIERCDRAMSKALLGQTLTSNEGEHQTRAATGSQKDVFDLLVEGGEKGIARMLRTVLHTLLSVNFGEIVARRFTPIVSLSAVEEADFAELATGVADLKKSGFLYPNQEAALAEKMGLPAGEGERETPAPAADPAGDAPASSDGDD